MPLLAYLLLSEGVNTVGIQMDNSPLRFIRRASERRYRELDVYICPTDVVHTINTTAMSLDAFVSFMAGNDVWMTPQFGRTCRWSGNLMDNDWVAVPVTDDIETDPTQLLILAMSFLDSRFYNGRINWAKKIAYSNYEGNHVYLDYSECQYVSIPYCNSVRMSAPTNIIFVLTKHTRMEGAGHIRVGEVDVPIYYGSKPPANVPNRDNYDLNFTVDLWPSWNGYFSTDNIGDMGNRCMNVFGYLARVVAVDESVFTAMALAAELSHVTRPPMSLNPGDEPNQAYHPDLNGGWSFGGGTLDHGRNGDTTHNILIDCTLANLQPMVNRMVGFNFSACSPNQLYHSGAVRAAYLVERVNGVIARRYVRWADPIGTKSLCQYHVPCVPSLMRISIACGMLKRSPNVIHGKSNSMQAYSYLIASTQAGSTVCFLSQNDIGLRNYMGWGTSTERQVDGCFSHIYTSISNYIFKHSDPAQYYRTISDVLHVDILECMHDYNGIPTTSEQWCSYSGVPMWFWMLWSEKMKYQFQTAAELVPETDSIHGQVGQGIIILDPKNTTIQSLALATYDRSQVPPLFELRGVRNMGGYMHVYPVDQYNYLGNRFFVDCAAEPALLATPTFHISMRYHTFWSRFCNFAFVYNSMFAVSAEKVRFFSAYGLEYPDPPADFLSKAENYTRYRNTSTDCNPTTAQESRNQAMDNQAQQLSATGAQPPILPVSQPNENPRPEEAPVVE